MELILNPPHSEWARLCERPADDNAPVRARVEAILERVRTQGDQALRDLSREIDGIPLETLEVSEAEFAEAEAQVSEAVKAAIEAAEAHIRAFHEAQRPAPVTLETAPGVRCYQKAVPIQRVGLYIPGGTAPLFSTVLMLAVPAKVAGCPELILCSPVSRTTGRIAPEVLYAARRCGVTRVFKAGGAQAIAAMAYGTESIPKVDKIFGPGNQYVTTAKQLLGGKTVAIDMPAGPSEVMVLADESARPDFVAADLLSQAEHGPDSQVMLVCDSEALARGIMQEVERQLAALPRSELATRALSHSRALVFPDRETRTAFANAYAAEHLILQVERPWETADRITAAGSVFVGPWSPESAGDYASGTNHTLPTSGWARAYSGVNLDSYLRKITYQELSRDGLEGLAGTITTLAEAEGLRAHAAAVNIRLRHD
ncbi:MAG: histidinol dehydrogenase [Bacteroidales bacterium]|nr:histidinol dehydrogenase [Bacteroidales bacterium]